MSATSEQPLAHTRRVPPHVLLLTSITSVQCGSAIATHLFDRAGPAGTASLRLVFGAIALALIFKPRLRSLTRAQVKVAAAFGLTLAAMNITFYEALDRLPLGVAVTIEFIGPLGVAIALSRRRLDVVWALLAGLGIVALVRPGGGSISTLGVILAVVAGGLWATYILLAQRLGRHFAGADGITVAMLIAAVVGVVPGVIDGGSALVAPHVLVLALFVALLSSAIPYTLEVEALRRIPARLFGVLMSLEPVAATLSGLVILGQSLNGRDVVAIALVVIASLGATLTSAPIPAPLDA